MNAVVHGPQRLILTRRTDDGLEMELRESRLARVRVVVAAMLVLPAAQIVGVVLLGDRVGFDIASSTYVVAALLAAVIARNAARHGIPAERTAWRYFAAGFTVMVVGSAIAGVVGSLGFTGIAHLGDYGRALAALLLVLGLRALPKGPHTRAVWQNALDATTSLVCFLLVTWVVFHDTLTAGSAVTSVFLFLPPIMNALLATAAVMVLISGRYGGGVSLRRMSAFAVGALLIAIGDCVMSLSGGLLGRPSPLALVPVTVGVLCFAWSAVRTEEVVQESIRSRLLVGSLSPVVPLVTAFVTVAFLVVFDEYADPTSIILSSATLLLVTIAVVTGRFDAFETRESMEQRVIQRTMDIGTREKWFRALVQNSSDVVTVVDVEGTVRYQTPSAERVLGHDPRLIVGDRLARLMHPDDGHDLNLALARAAESPNSVQTLEFPLWHRDGHWCETETTITSLVDEPHVRGIVLNTRDVSERRLLETELMHQAYSDALTGLANRARFRDRTRDALETADAMGVAVLFLDLNGFKAVNDTQGHAIGDRVLTLVGQRLKNSVRPGDLVARLGGDEFGILVTGEQAEGSAVWVAERARRVLAHDFEIDGRKVPLGASIGIAFNEHGTETADQLLSNADLAMYRAKTSERSEFVRFESAMHDDLIEQVKAEADLRSAVTSGELSLNYQPIVDLVSGTTVGVEALARWQHPERGLVPPTEFIELAERTGLVEQIGTWALREACRHAARWQRFAAPGGVFRVAVNVSARQLNPDFPDTVRDALESGGVPGQALTIEVTESVLMERPEEAIEILTRVKALGVRIAVDDFGTGYSSLSYLARFPVDILKIDRSFVADVTAASGKSELARTIVHLGSSLGLVTVAEGIETTEQHLRLQEMGCPLGQGFLFARPMPADEVDPFLLGAGRTIAAAGTAH